MTIVLTQWLCPLRHLAYGVAWNDAEHTAAAIEQLSRQLIGTMVNDHCGICGGSISPVHVPTLWSTMDQANAALAEETVRQAALRRTLDAAGMTLERWPRE